MAQSFGTKILYHQGKLNAATAIVNFETPDGVDHAEIEKARTMIIGEARNYHILKAVVASNHLVAKPRLFLITCKYLQTKNPVTKEHYFLN